MNSTSSQLVFIYDELLRKSEQEILSLGLRFICFGTVKAQLMFLNDNKKKRLFIVPNTGKSTTVTYGALFELTDFESDKYKLYSYYNSLIPFVGSPMKEDVYVPKELQVTPIKFKNLKDIESLNYLKGKPVTAMTFIGNPENQLIQYNCKRKYYYKVNSVNSQGFIQCIKDNFKTTKKEEVKT